MPLGRPSVIYLQPNNDPRGQNFLNVREGPTWFFTTPQGWILDHPERGIIIPLEGPETLEFDPPADGDTNLRACRSEGSRRVTSASWASIRSSA